MFHSHQSYLADSSSYFIHQSHPPNPNPNPNPFLFFSQPALPSTETTIQPPGTDPYANSGSYPLPHGGFGYQPQYHEDPDAGSQNWVVKQADPIRYEAGIKSLNESSTVSASSNFLWNSNWTNQPLANDITNRVPRQTKGIQSMRCEACNIDCNSKDVYDKHILGKKHTRNLQLQTNPTASVWPKTSHPINNTSLQGQMGGMAGQMILGASSMATGKELETKRRKLLNGGASVDSVRVCTTCNVACNSQEVFNKHLAGKKHAAQASLSALTGIAPLFTAIRTQNNAFWKRVQKKVKVVQSVWCKVCKINCNSNDVYIKHLSGKKHLNNLEKLEKPKNNTIASASVAAPATTNPIIGPMENPEINKSKSVDVETSRKKAAQSQAPGEDLESKKRKVLEGGAAAGAVRTCTICNVVCNSQAVFNFHLVGQKHAAMVKKMAEAGMVTAA